MSTKDAVKRHVPAWLLEPYRAIWRRIHRRRLLSSIPATARKLYEQSTLATHAIEALSPADEAVRQAVMEAAKTVYGDAWNFYSDALRPEIAQGFVKTVDSMLPRQTPIHYLEIGSCQGMSISFIALLLRSRGVLGKLVSIDPYFETGYDEGALGPYQAAKHVSIDKATRRSAFRLYELLQVEVELLEDVSRSALTQLVRDRAVFDLIYIDGYHETLVPLVDLGLSTALLAADGVIVLDDWMWPDVLPLKQLCDRHAMLVQETWKTASYKLR